MLQARSRGPWASRSSRTSWYRKIATAARLWQPHPALEINTNLCRQKLLDAIDAGASWLLHPCINTLTYPGNTRKLQRDFLLVAWTAINNPGALGNVSVPNGTIAWTSDGGVLVSPGTYDLEQLGAQFNQSEWPFRIALDVWGQSLGFILATTWASLGQNIFEASAEQLDLEIRTFMRSLSLLESIFPDCHQWVTSVTKVVVPFHHQAGNEFHSSSTEDLPGVISMDLVDELQVLEAMVHESAHRHLYLRVEDGPLVIPGHTDRYHSPLRPEPRPLEGIFKAYHALAYICAFYADAVHKSLIGKHEQDLADLKEKLNDAETTMVTNRQFLTENGCELLDQTFEVAEYGRA